MPAKSTRGHHPDHEDAQSLTRWAELCESKDYRVASHEMRRLTGGENRALAAYSIAHDEYVETLNRRDEVTTALRDRYEEAHAVYKEARRRLEEKEEAICRTFGIFMWRDPMDKTVTWENSGGITGSAPAVKVIGRTGDDGWLTIAVNLRETLGNIRGPLLRLIRMEQSLLGKPKTRKRPDVRVKEINVFLHWRDGDRKSLAPTAKSLKMPFSTTRRHFRNAFKRLKGEVPATKIKVRQSSGITSFDVHVIDCARCKKGATSGNFDDFCKPIQKWVDQDATWDTTKREAIKIKPEEGKQTRKPRLTAEYDGPVK